MIEQKYKNIFIELIEQGNFDQALLLGNELSQSFPDEPEGYNMVADAFRLKGDYQSSQKFYALSLVKDPKQPHVLIMLGEVNISLGQIHEADTLFCDALEMAPKDTHVLYKCGFYYMGKGESESAEYLFNHSIELGNLKAYNGLLDLYVFKQELQKIKLLLKTQWHHLPSDSLSIGRAHCQIDQYQEAFDYLNNIRVEAKSPTWLRCYYNLLGSTLDNLKRYDEAFLAYEKQNKNSVSQYSIEDAELYLKAMLEMMNNNVETVPKDKKFKTAPLFILGAPRSGSSLIEQILNTQDNIVIGGELNFIALAYNGWVNKESELNDIAEWYREKLNFYIKENPEKNSVSWVTDKMPSNWQFIEFILNLLPDAKIIYSKRSALDIGLSIFKQNLVDAHPYATKLENIAHHIHLVETTMKHWMARYPQNILMIDYEVLVNDFEHETKRMMQFLGLEWNKELAGFYKNSNVTLTASRDQVRKPLYSSSIDVSQRYGKYLDPLKKSLREYQIK